MSNEDVKRHTADAIRERVRRGESRTDLARIDADVIECFRGTGRGWQTRVNAVLRAW